MADNNLAVGSPIPQGAQIGEAQASPSSSLKPGDAIPQGAQVGAQPQSGSGGLMDSIGGAIDSVGHHASNIVDNITAGAVDTGMGLSDMGHAAIHKVLPEKVADVLSPKSGMYEMHDVADPLREQKGSGLDKFIGYGGETLLEFMTGESALKGLPMAQKLKYGSQIMSVLEQSPKLMQALKEGASLMKVADQLGPAEREILRRFPAIARRIAVDSATAGTAQGAQTLARTGGDVPGALKEGAEMAAGSGVIGAVAEPVASALSKGNEAAEGVKVANTVAEKGVQQRETARNALEQSQNALQAPGKRATTDQVRSWLKQADDARHDMMEVGEQNLKDRLQGEAIPAKEAPMAEHAQQLLDNPPVDTSGEHEVEREAKAASRDLLHPRVQNMLEMIASGEKPVEAAEAEGDKAPLLYDAQNKPIEGAEEPSTEPIQDWNVDNLIGARKSIRKLAAQFPRGDINRRVLGKLMEGVDDTFQSLADQAGDSKAGADYGQLRQVYKKASDEIERSRFVQDLMNDKTGQAHSDFGKVLLGSGDRFEDRLENLRSILNSKQMDQVSEGFAKNLMDEGPDALLKLSPDRIDKISQLVGPKNVQALGDMVRNVVKADGASKMFSMTPTSLDRVEKWVGKQGLKDLTADGMRDLFAQASDAEGNVDPDKFLDSWKTFTNKSAYRRLLDSSQVRKAAQNVITQMEHSSDFKKLVQAVGMGPAVAAGAGAGFYLSHLGPVADILGLGSMVLGFKSMSDFVKKLADSPKLWEVTSKLDNAAKSKAVRGIKEGAKYGTGKGLKYVLGGASSALGGGN